MPYANSPSYMCREECGHRLCDDCHGGHAEKHIGRDGLCDSCRRYRAIQTMMAEELKVVMWSLEMFLGDGLRLKRKDEG